MRPGNILSFLSQYRRRVSQTLSLILLHSSWGPEFKWICNPVLSCHSCVLAWFACPIGVLAHYSAYLTFPFLAVGMVLLVGVLVGRLLCGWVCPFGFLMDLLHKIPSPKFALPQWTTYIKYVILAMMVIILPALFSENTIFSFCRICPASAVEVTIPNWLTGVERSFDIGTAVKLGILLGVLGLAIFSGRSFCKMLCPIGALLGPLNYISLWAMRSPPRQACTGCNKCNDVCPMDGEPLSRMKQDVAPNRLQDCLVCHDCQLCCPQKDATQRVADPAHRQETV